MCGHGNVSCFMLLLLASDGGLPQARVILQTDM